MKEDKGRPGETGFVILTPRKPAKGQDCNGCGTCCIAEPCRVSRMMALHPKGVCEALRWDMNLHRYFCSVVESGFLPKSVFGDGTCDSC